MKNRLSKSTAKIMTVLFLFLGMAISTNVNAQTITTAGNTFVPDTITCIVGDTIIFNLGPGHDAVEVDMITYMANGTASNGGFVFGFGATDTLVTALAQTYYYVCTPHVGFFEMKGVIIANSSSTITVTESPASSVSVNDGEAIVSVSGGIGPYTYYWQNISTGAPASGPTTTVAMTDTFSNAPSGTYIIYVSDNGTTPATFSSDTLTITAPGGSFTYTGLALCGNSTTTITANLNGCSFIGPTLGTQYILTDSTLGIILLDTTFVDSVIVLPPLGAGTYYLSALNLDNGCTANDTFTIVDELIFTSLFEDVGCYGDSTGIAYVDSISGGTPPYSYLWSTGETTDSISNLPADTFWVQVTDALGCLLNPVSDTMIITEPPVLESVITIVSHATCDSSQTLATGEMNVVPFGGVGPYTFLWSSGGLGCTDPTALNYDPSATIDDGSCCYFAGCTDPSAINFLMPGEYIVEITDSNGCTVLDTAEILPGTNPDLAPVIQDVSCPGSNDGTITSFAIGGTAPYQFSIDVGVTFDPSGTVFGPYGPIGFYMTVVDSLGCSDADSVYVSESDGILVFSVSTTNISNGILGSASITVLNGAPPYSLCWQDPAVAPPCDTILSWSTGDTLTGLAAGTYTYTVVDSGGCNIGTGSITIEEGCFAELSNSFTICDSLVYLDAEMNMLDTLGVYSFDYQLTDSLGTIINSLITTTDSIRFTNPITSAGWYYLTVTDSVTGCIATDSINVVMNPITVTSIVNEITTIPCDGSISVTPITGQFPYTFTWDTTGAISTPFTTNQDSLCEDTFCLAIVDDNGCTYNECYELHLHPCDVTMGVIDNILCFGDSTGSIQANIDTMNFPLGDSLFTGPRFTFELFITTSPLTLVATESTDSLFALFSNLPSNTYYVSVFDSSYNHYCTSFDSLFLPQTNPIEIFLAVTDTLGGYHSVDSSSAPWMQDGVITINSITGGTPGYNITWLDSVGIPLPTSGVLVQDSLGYSNEYNGGYTIIVTDTNGCGPATEVVYVHPIIDLDSLLLVDKEWTEPTCFGDCDGELFAQAYKLGTHAVPPFTFKWYDALTATLLKTDSCIYDSLSMSFSCSPWYNPSHVATYVNRCAGVYTLYAFDYYGNPFDTNPLEYVLDEPDSMYVVLDQQDFVIPCGEDSVLTSVVTGGNVLNDTTFINTYTLDFSAAPTGFSDTLTPGTEYLMVVTGSYQDSIDTFDAAYQFDPVTLLEISPTSPMNWEMNGGPAPRPDPDVYNDPLHRYYFPFIGTGIHEFEMLSLGFTGMLEFNLYKITRDTSIYTYSWETIPASVPAVISTADTALAYPGLDPKDYILTVLDVKGCEAIDSVNVSWDLYILNFDSIHVSNVSCNGDSTGSIIAIIDTATGFPFYTIYIDGVATTDTTVNLPAASYTMHIQDSIGCLSLDSIVSVVEPDSLYACGVDTADISVLVDEFTMTFDTAFSATTVFTQLGLEYKIVVSGTYRDEWNSTPPVHTKDAAYQFNVGPFPINEWGWNGIPAPRPTPDIYDPATHTYEYYFIGTGAAQVFNYEDLTGDYTNNDGALDFKLYKIQCSITDTAYSCFDDSTATATVFPLGGVPLINSIGNPYYNVVWTDDLGVIWGTDATVSGLPAGNYTATIYDSLDCTFERYLVVIQPSTPIAIDSLAQINVMCKGDSTGEIHAVVSGGFGPRYVVLTLGLDTVYSMGGLSSLSDTISMTGLAAGTYEFYLYDTIPDGLYGIYNYECEQNVQITITAPQDYLTSSVSLLTDVLCWGDSTGSAIANVIGGQFPYTYAWDNGDTTPLATGLWAGTPSIWHVVTFTDANDCILLDSIEITHIHPQIIGTLTVVQDNSCFNACDGIATLSTIGGVLPHTYTWDTGEISVNMPHTVFNLCAGGHDIIVEDALFCRQIIAFTVSEPDLLEAQAIGDGATAPGVITQPIQCFGFDDGTAFGSATGGTPGYSFVWDSINGQVGQNAVALTPGEHILYVTDSKGCTAYDTVVITEPTQLEVEIIDSMTIYTYCANTNSGQLCAIASGGTASGGASSYNYVWNDVLGQTTSCAYNLTAGNYTVIVMDDRNCIASTSWDLDSVTNTFTSDSVDMTIVDVSCFGAYNGSVTINSVVGGLPPYTYNWAPAVGTGATISSLYAGSYAIVITDSSGCPLTLNANVGEPEKFQYNTYNVIGETCFGACDGQIWVNIEGGTGNYYYDSSELGSFPIASANQVQLVNDSLIYDLCSGLHSIYITDDNNCEAAVKWGGDWEEVVDSGVVVTAPLVVTTPASCANSFDGAAWIPWPGANSLFTYTWETTALPTTIVDTGVSTSILSPGAYVLVAHYADSASFGQVYSGCDASSLPFSILSPSVITSGAIALAVSCWDDDDGSIDLTISGGVSPYSVAWDITTSIPGSTIQDHNNLLPGTYTVTITDASGCSITEAITVEEPEALTLDFNPIIQISCNGFNDGSVTVVATGGTGAYSYLWSPSGGTSDMISSLTPGLYEVVVTDVNGCSETDDISIVEPLSVIAYAAVDSNYYGPFDVSCYGKSDGSATAYGNGVSFIWTDAAGTIVDDEQSTGMILSAGTYTVTASDTNGCTADASVVITEPNELLANITWSAYSTVPYEVSCYGANDGRVESKPTGGYIVNDYDYEWKDNSGNSLSVTHIADDLTANKSYTVTVTDVNGCQTLETTPVFTEPVDFVADVQTTNYAGPTHAPFTVNFADYTVCTDPYNFNWTWEDGTDYFASGTTEMNHEFTVNNVGLNIVYVVLTNEVTGCTSDTVFIIEGQGFPDNEIFNVFSPNNDGINDEFIFGEYGMENIEVYLYNRWGQEVYSWVGANKAWDGKGADGQNLPEGVYFFIFKADGIDGHFYGEKGSITIVR